MKFKFANKQNDFLNNKNLISFYKLVGYERISKDSTGSVTRKIVDIRLRKGNEGKPLFHFQNALNLQASDTFCAKNKLAVWV